MTKTASLGVELFEGTEPPTVSIYNPETGKLYDLDYSEEFKAWGCRSSSMGWGYAADESYGTGNLDAMLFGDFEIEDEPEIGMIGISGVVIDQTNNHECDFEKFLKLLTAQESAKRL